MSELPKRPNVLGGYDNRFAESSSPIEKRLGADPMVSNILKKRPAMLAPHSDQRSSSSISRPQKGQNPILDFFLDKDGEKVEWLPQSVFELLRSDVGDEVREHYMRAFVRFSLLALLLSIVAKITEAQLMYVTGGQQRSTFSALEIWLLLVSGLATWWVYEGGETSKEEGAPIDSGISRPKILTGSDPSSRDARKRDNENSKINQPSVASIDFQQDPRSYIEQNYIQTSVVISNILLGKDVFRGVDEGFMSGMFKQQIKEANPIVEDFKNSISRPALLHGYIPGQTRVVPPNYGSQSVVSSSQNQAQVAYKQPTSNEFQVKKIEAQNVQSMDSNWGSQSTTQPAQQCQTDNQTISGINGVGNGQQMLPAPSQAAQASRELTAASEARAEAQAQLEKGREKELEARKKADELAEQDAKERAEFTHLESQIHLLKKVLRERPVREVLQKNLETEFEAMSLTAKCAQYCIVSLMYPGCAIIGRLPTNVVAAYLQNYAALRDSLNVPFRVIQIAFTFLDADGAYLPNVQTLAKLADNVSPKYRDKLGKMDESEYPAHVTTWQFMFKFDKGQDLVGRKDANELFFAATAAEPGEPSALEQMDRGEIQARAVEADFRNRHLSIGWQKHLIEGITLSQFAERMGATKFLQKNRHLTWLSFDGIRDFAFLYRSCTASQRLPQSISDYIADLDGLFPNRVDVKHLLAQHLAEIEDRAEGLKTLQWGRTERESGADGNDSPADENGAANGSGAAKGNGGADGVSIMDLDLWKLGDSVGVCNDVVTAPFWKNRMDLLFQSGSEAILTAKILQSFKLFSHDDLVVAIPPPDESPVDEEGSVVAANVGKKKKGKNKKKNANNTQRTQNQQETYDKMRAKSEAAIAVRKTENEDILKDNVILGLHPMYSNSDYLLFRTHPRQANLIWGPKYTVDVHFDKRFARTWDPTPHQIGRSQRENPDLQKSMELLRELENKNEQFGKSARFLLSIFSEPQHQLPPQHMVPPLGVHYMGAGGHLPAYMYGPPGAVSFKGLPPGLKGAQPQTLAEYDLYMRQQMMKGATGAVLNAKGLYLENGLDKGDKGGYLDAQSRADKGAYLEAKGVYLDARGLESKGAYLEAKGFDAKGAHFDKGKSGIKKGYLDKGKGHPPGTELSGKGKGKRK